MRGAGAGGGGGSASVRFAGAAEKRRGWGVVLRRIAVSARAATARARSSIIVVAEGSEGGKGASQRWRAVQRPIWAVL